MNARNSVLPSLICLLLLILAGCEVATSARLGVGPSFSLMEVDGLYLFMFMVLDRGVRLPLLLMTSRLCGISPRERRSWCFSYGHADRIWQGANRLRAELSQQWSGTFSCQRPSLHL